jgi:S1-C subfamily serine protease
MSRVRWAAAVALAAAFAAFLVAVPAGCGGDDEGSGGGRADNASAQGEERGQPAERIAIQTASGGFDPAAIYEQVSAGVVTIRSIFGASSADILGGGGAGQGSGFVISEDGEIVTNAHVVTDGQAGGSPDLSEAQRVFVQFADRNQVPADVVGFDPFADVALLRVDPDEVDLEPLELGSTDDVEVGEPVAAIGSPFGQDQSLSTGIVSATNRSIDSLTQFSIDGAIQTDASINPGNSGGPLIDADGEVIGIDQQINTTSGGNEGVGFALPIDLARRSIEQLREDGEVEYAYLGVRTAPLYPQLGERLGIDAERGALVTHVVDGSPADEAEIQGGDQRVQFQGVPYQGGGDVITHVEGEEIVGEADLPRLIALLDPGDEIELDILRDGETDTVDVTLAKRPD